MSRDQRPATITIKYVFFVHKDDADKPSAEPEPNVGSIDSITTDLASIEDGMGDDKRNTIVTQEKWYQMTIQVAIPFFLAGIGTIGAGVILGHVEVS